MEALATLHWLRLPERANPPGKHQPPGNLLPTAISGKITLCC